MLSKKKFVEIIEKLRKVNEFVDEVKDKARQLDDAIISDFFNASSLSISHENIVVELLEEMFNVDDTISWWIYELDYGRKYEGGCIQDEEGNNIDVSTAEKLYDYLIKEQVKCQRNSLC